MGADPVSLAPAARSEITAYVPMDLGDVPVAFDYLTLNEIKTAVLLNSGGKWTKFDIVLRLREKPNVTSTILQEAPTSLAEKYHRDDLNEEPSESVILTLIAFTLGLKVFIFCEPRKETEQELVLEGVNMRPTAKELEEAIQALPVTVRHPKLPAPENNDVLDRFERTMVGLVLLQN